MNKEIFDTAIYFFDKKKIPNECIDIIKKEYFKKKTYKDKQCVLCSLENLSLNEYVDGVGYLCYSCS